MRPPLALLSPLLALGASAAPGRALLPRQAAASPSSADALLLIGGGSSGTIATATFDGTNFNIVSNSTIPGTSASWLLFKEPNLLYATDQSSNSTRLFTLDPTTNALTLVQNATGSSGVVFLEFNIDQTRMLGASFGGGQVDVWDVSAPGGAMTLVKQIASDDPLGPNAAQQASPHPNQVLLENSGRFFTVPDLGTDTILVIDGLNDAFTVANHVRMPSAGCGPRHGAFFPLSGADFATNYLVVCELLNTIQVFNLDFSGNNMTLTPSQTISTFGPGLGPANLTAAAAGEIAVSADNAFVYVSNRNTGNATDSISVFSVAGAQGSSGNITLSFVQSISSGGLLPSMFSLSDDAAQAKLFAVNQNGQLGLVAIDRAADGQLDQANSAAGAPPSLALDIFGPPGNGPQFVHQIQLHASPQASAPPAS